MNRAAFTLVEVLVAIGIVAVGIIGMIQAVALGAEMLDTTRKQEIATRLVNAELQRLRSGAWSTIANLPSTATITIGSTGAITGDTTSFALANFTVTTADDNTSLAAMAPGYTVSLASTRLRPTGATASTVTFQKLAYTVTWTSSTGRTHTRRFETYVGQNGLHLSYQQT